MHPDRTCIIQTGDGERNKVHSWQFWLVRRGAFGAGFEITASCTELALCKPTTSVVGIGIRKRSTGAESG